MTMQIDRRCIMPEVYLTHLRARQFKTGLLSAQLVTPHSGRTAAANALLPQVLYRGTMRFPDMEKLSAQLDRMYGAEVSPTVRKRGESHCVGFVMSFVDDALVGRGEQLLERGAMLLGELLLDPVTRSGRFLNEYVDGEKANLIDVIRAERNDKREWAELRLVQEMCAGEPYGVSRWGEEASVRALNNQKLCEHYRRLLASSRLELTYCGAADPVRVREALLESFATLPRGAVPPLRSPVRRAAPAQPRFVTETMDVGQGKLSMGFRCGSDDVPALVLANLLFGGSSNSKLFMNVREKLSLCYYASSTYARAKGIITVSSGIESRNVQRAQEEILTQLRAVQTGQWEAWELAAAMAAARSALQTLGDSQGALENYYLGQTATGQFESPEELLEQLAAVTPERIRVAAESIALDTVYFLRGKEEA